MLPLALAAVLAGPVAYSLATVGRSVGGGNPKAGPAAAESGLGGVPGEGGALAGGFPGAGGPRPFGGARGVASSRPPGGPGLPRVTVAVAQTPDGLTEASLRAGLKKPQVVARLQRALPDLGTARALSDGHSECGAGFRRRLCATASTTGGGAAGAGGFGRVAGAGGPGGAGQVSKRLVAYLEAHRDGAKYLVAADGSMTAAPLILATHQLVVTVGGFSGQDPAPTATQLEQLVSSGQLRYVYGFGGASSAGGPPGGGLLGGGAPAGGGTPGGGLPGDPGGLGGSASGARALQTWVTAHCKAVSGYSGLEQCSAT